ncbi:MAG: AAA family ATPase [Eubacteriales bacterium]
MKNLEREYIAIGFDDDKSKITPVICMSGSKGNEKVIQEVESINKISVYHIDFVKQITENIGNIPWPDVNMTSDIVIRFDLEKNEGTVQIKELDQVWSYSVVEKNNLTEPKKKTSETSQINLNKRTIVDKDKVRQLEQEKDIKILWPDELATELSHNVFGQDEAIKVISEIIATNLRRKKPEVEVLVLFGPTGVGKTETGKALPSALEKLTGQEYGFQQIAMNQYTEAHSLQQWFGSPPSYVGYQDPTIFEPCRTNPYQVFLLDEVEKSNDRIWTGLMECFSNSSVKLADNTAPIDLSHTIFILTSNVPIDMQVYNIASSFQKKELCRDALTRTCGHPEVAGKIGNCLAFQDLARDAVTDIVTKFVAQELENNDMELEHIDEYLMVELKKLHKNSKYGARSIKDAIRTALIFTAYDRDIDKYKGKRVDLSGDVEHIIIKVIS